jgi:outer membrane protein assembly factor BamB
MTFTRCLPALLLALVAGADWPDFLGPTRDGHSPEKGLLARWPARGPRELWRHEAGEGYSGPAVADGRVFLFHRVDDKEVIEALDAKTGKPRWAFRYPTAYRDGYGKGDGPRATPVISGGKVYTLGAEGTLTCVDAQKGKKVWQRALPKDYAFRKGFFGVGTTPLVEGDLVLVNVGAEGAGIVAFDKNTGKEVWKATDDEASYSSPVAATVGGKRLVFFFTREGLVALDPKTGKVRHQHRWRSRTFASVNAATPLVIGDHVFLTSSYRTGALLLRFTGDRMKEVWKGDDSLSAHYNTPVRIGDYLYGIDGRQEAGARLRCIEWKTGKVRWTKEGFGCASLIAADGKLIALREDGNLVLLDPSPEGYREVSRAAMLEGTCRAPLALAEGRLYGRDGKKLICWDLKGR